MEYRIRHMKNVGCGMWNIKYGMRCRDYVLRTILDILRYVTRAVERDTQNVKCAISHIQNVRRGIQKKKCKVLNVKCELYRYIECKI